MTPHQVVVMLLREIDNLVFVDIGRVSRLLCQRFTVLVGFGDEVLLERHDGQSLGGWRWMQEDPARSPCGASEIYTQIEAGKIA